MFDALFPLIFFVFVVTYIHEGDTSSAAGGEDPFICGVLYNGIQAEPKKHGKRIWTSEEEKEWCRFNYSMKTRPLLHQTVDKNIL